MEEIKKFKFPQYVRAWQCPICKKLYSNRAEAFECCKYKQPKLDIDKEIENIGNKLEKEIKINKPDYFKFNVPNELINYIFYIHKYNSYNRILSELNTIISSENNKINQLEKRLKKLKLCSLNKAKLYGNDILYTIRYVNKDYILKDININNINYKFDFGYFTVKNINNSSYDDLNIIYSISEQQK